MHHVPWAESAASQAGAQASGYERVKVGTEPPADKFWEEAKPGWWEVCLCAMLRSCSRETIPALPYPLPPVPVQSSQPSQPGPAGKSGRSQKQGEWLQTRTMASQEDYLQLLFTLLAPPFTSKSSTSQSAINNQGSE